MNDQSPIGPVYGDSGPPLRVSQPVEQSQIENKPLLKQGTLKLNCAIGICILSAVFNVTRELSVFPSPL